MEENIIKNRIIIALGIVILMLLISNVSSCGSAYRSKAARDKEMATRMDLEEKMSAFTQQKSAADDKAAQLNKTLEDEKAAHQATRNALTQEKLVNQSLKEELEKIIKLKEALEEDLKEALVASKTTRPKQ
ncbi:MAG: hypothetical protein PHR11_02625 [Candidatus Omnitrophica bacterium]|nr:hypothetical protein [Candidatus Omnitrophota bacterium]